MPDDRDNFNSMQMQAGLLPPFAAAAPPMTTPGMVSAMLSSGGPAALFGGMGMGMGMGMGGMGFPMSPMGASYNPYASGGGGNFAGSLYGGGGGGSPFGGGGMHGGPGHFQSPYAHGIAQHQEEQRRMFAGTIGVASGAARFGTDLLGGAMGAYYGGRAGGGVGAAIGGIAGFMGTELSGLGRMGQSAFTNSVLGPAVNTNGYARGIEQMSQGFVAGGAFGSASGSGFSPFASAQAALGMEGLSRSSQFQAQTSHRFNTADVMRLGQMGASEGLMGGVQSPTEMRERVRELAKTLSSFMELAQEPDLQRAIQTMGQLRTSGLNLGETRQAVANGRTFARMAGTTFSQLSEMGGSMGSMTYQGMGLTQGLGFQAGMANFGMAQSSANAGVLGPQMMNLLGGAQGYAQQQNAYGASYLQQPMVAAGLMSGHGGMSTGGMQRFLGGGSDMFSLTSQATSSFGDMSRRYGTAGLGMGVAMQPMMQDAVGRMMAAQGPFATRQGEDHDVIGLARRMGMSGSGGYVTAGMAMGMSNNQALARARELGSGVYWNRQRDQIEVNRRERRGEELRDHESERPGLMDELSQASTGFASVRRGLGDFTRGISRAYQGMVGGGPEVGYRAQTDYEHRQMSRTARSGSFRDFMRSQSGDEGAGGLMDRFGTARNLAEARGSTGIGSFFAGLGGMSEDHESQRAAMQDYRRGGQAAQSLANASTRDVMQARRGLGATFGADAAGVDAQHNFSGALRGLFGSGNGLGGMAVNAGVRGLGLLGSRGAVDTGNVVQDPAVQFSQMRGAFADSMVRARGGNRAEYEQMFERDPNRIMQQVSPLAEMGMNSGERQRLRNTIQTGQNMHEGGGTFMSRGLAHERGGYGRIFGDGSDNHLSRAYDNLSRRSRGVGTGERERESRNIMTAFGMTMAATQDPNATPEERAQQDAARQQLHREMQRRGYTQDQISTLVQRSTREFRNVGGDEDTRLLGRRFMRTHAGHTGRQIIDAVSQGERERAEGSLARNVAGGAEALGRGGGALGHIFGGMNAQRFDQNEFEGAIDRASESDLSQLSRGSRGQRNIASLIRRVQQGDGRARGALTEAIGAMGQTAANAQSEYARSSVLSRFMTRGQSVFDTERDFINRATAGGTRADEDATRQQLDTTAAQGEARGQGLGGAGDQLLAASRNLNRAAELFSERLEGNSVGDILNRNDG
jgi:hypothetical protein